MSLDIYLEQEVTEMQTVSSHNATHNLGRLWRHIGVHDALYESQGKLAEEVYPALVVGIDHMLEKPDECRAFDAPNGWGTYDGALRFLQRVAEDFRRYPKARIRVSA